MKPILQPVQALQVPEQRQKSLYPERFASQMHGRVKRKLGDFFGLANFGINHTMLPPKSVSALKHTHSKQDEFVYILEGEAVLLYGEEVYDMRKGDCFGFVAGAELAHQLKNEANEPLVYLEIGDRSPDDDVVYPNDDLAAKMDNSGRWVFTHKDGTPY